MRNRLFIKRIFSSNHSLPEKGTVSYRDGCFYMNKDKIERQKMKKEISQKYKNLPYKYSSKKTSNNFQRTNKF